MRGYSRGQIPNCSRSPWGRPKRSLVPAYFSRQARQARKGFHIRIPLGDPRGLARGPFGLRRCAPLWTSLTFSLTAGWDASPHRFRQTKMGRILPPSPERCASGLGRGKPDEPRKRIDRDPHMNPRFLRGVAALRPPPGKTTRADPNMRSLQLNVHGHHPKRRPAAHSKGACHVPLDCGAARRFGLPLRFLSWLGGTPRLTDFVRRRWGESSRLRPNAARRDYGSASRMSRKRGSIVLRTSTRAFSATILCR